MSFVTKYYFINNILGTIYAAKYVFFTKLFKKVTGEIIHSGDLRRYLF
jgi:hypothetical protein